MSVGFKRVLFFLSALSVFVLAVLYLEDGEYLDDGKYLDEGKYDQNSVSGGEPKALVSSKEPLIPALQLPVVSIVEAGVSESQLEIPVFGELKPKWNIAIKSQASGEVIHIASQAEIGARVRSGDSLVELDSIRYQARVDQAELALEQAKLDLILAKQKTALAQQDWERSGLRDAPTELMLFKPQLALAERKLKSVQSQLKVAQKDLSETQIKAVFDGVVIERNVGLGQYVVEGETLVRIVDDQNLLLQVAVGEQQWLDLSDDWKGTHVSLYSDKKQLLGQAILSRGGDVLDAQSRQFLVSLDVPPKLRNKARAGQYVTANLPGKRVENILNLPESALTQDATIWLVDHEGYLKEYRPQSYHPQNGRVLVDLPPKQYAINGIWQIATQPLSYFISGKQVSIKSSTVKDSSTLSAKVLAH